MDWPKYDTGSCWCCEAFFGLFYGYLKQDFKEYDEMHPELPGRLSSIREKEGNLGVLNYMIDAELGDMARLIEGYYPGKWDEERDRYDFRDTLRSYLDLRKLRRVYAALVIQRAWRKVADNPYNSIGRKLAMNSFPESFNH